ncbi:hypothetical protein BpHYR1_031371 [Brachionus plicatilis]|uniref:Secreted protein n=1 Tax=Brachionus plicatilis TaxID=10195 RepID=A0A3M7PIV1_BRAPC|nr:hypothetical protein BpHYR1_031371 [Brachionus plicatilis]
MSGFSIQALILILMTCTTLQPNKKKLTGKFVIKTLKICSCPKQKKYFAIFLGLGLILRNNAMFHKCFFMDDQNRYRVEKQQNTQML